MQFGRFFPADDDYWPLHQGRAQLRVQILIETNHEFTRAGYGPNGSNGLEVTGQSTAHKKSTLQKNAMVEGRREKMWPAFSECKMILIWGENEKSIGV